MCPKTILDENKEYWTGRASGYSEVNRHELSTEQRQRWKDCLYEELTQHFSDRALTDLRVLDVGTGPGFFAILLRELGCNVTAIDLTPAMLAEAKENAGSLAAEIQFMEMNAEALHFTDKSFDVIISRNLTWNLPHPPACIRGMGAGAVKRRSAAEFRCKLVCLSFRRRRSGGL